MMRVQYTLPGYQPAAKTTPGATAGRSFHAKLQKMAAPITIPWKRLLRLDTPPPNAASLAAPEMPDSMQSRNVQDERARLRFLAEHSLQHPNAARLSEVDRSRLSAMLGLVEQMQKEEDGLISQRTLDGGK